MYCRASVARGVRRSHLAAVACSLDQRILGTTTWVSGMVARLSRRLLTSSSAPGSRCHHTVRLLCPSNVESDWYCLCVPEPSTRRNAVDTFRLCSPTRASIMSGRYPWGVGFYNMQSKSKTNGFSDSFHCVAPEIPLLPYLLKQQGCKCTNPH